MANTKKSKKSRKKSKRSSSSRKKTSGRSKGKSKNTILKRNMMSLYGDDYGVKNAQNIRNSYNKMPGMQQTYGNYRMSNASGLLEPLDAYKSFDGVVKGLIKGNAVGAFDDKSDIKVHNNILTLDSMANQYSSQIPKYNKNHSNHQFASTIASLPNNGIFNLN